MISYTPPLSLYPLLAQRSLASSMCYLFVSPQKCRLWNQAIEKSRKIIHGFALSTAYFFFQKLWYFLNWNRWKNIYCVQSIKKPCVKKYLFCLLHNFTTAVKKSGIYGGIFKPVICKIKYINMQNNS